MKNNHNKANNNSNSSNGFLPNSLKFISSCIKTASSGVRSASASVAASISGDPNAHKDQVLCACVDKLELGPTFIKHVLLLGYSNGFQVLDVENASSVGELVSKRDDPVTFLQMQPRPTKSNSDEGFAASHPLLLVVACDETQSSGLMQNGRDVLARNGYSEHQNGHPVYSPTAVRFYSLRSHNYVHVLRFRSTVYMVRCSPQIVAVGLASQIYCFDPVTLQSKFSVLTFPVPQLGVQGMVVANIGYGPMAVGPRWLAYASNNPLQSNVGRLSPQSLTPPGVSPSTSPSNGSLMARYAKESSKQLAAGILNLGDMGYKTLSKYYQELVPDGSGSPVPSNCSWKVGRGHLTESEIAGMVVVQDFTSKAIVSQFRAHTSPISALCFDPSGTLLVTASIHGNNINIFRIMPSCSHMGSGTQNYDWSTSHVHLYKLHRGMTSAVIQDICFSQYSQWVSIITSRGTSHIFALSPFGGETVLQAHNSPADGPTLLPTLSLPWWSSSSFTVNKQSFSPPPQPVTLSVVSRIKNNSSGWLNTVSNAASSAAGKMLLPSGAMTAVFHSCVPPDLQPGHAKVNALERLLVYAPSGHVIQYNLLPSVGGESTESASRSGPGSSLQMQDDELRVKVEPVQWWDVCRRTDWPERDECISGITCRKQEAMEMVMDVSDCEDNDTRDKELVKPHEKSHLYISNAEVQINSGRIPIWQNAKISFFTMSSMEANNITDDLAVGEIEIEKIPVNEVEIKRKDLLPVFNHFPVLQSNWGDRVRREVPVEVHTSIMGGLNFYRGLVGSHSSADSHEAKENFSEMSVMSNAKLASTGSFEPSDGIFGDSYSLSHQSAIQSSGGKNGKFIFSSRLQNQSSTNKDLVSYSSRQSTSNVSHVEDSTFATGLSTLADDSMSADRTISKEVQSVDGGGQTDGSNVSSNRSDLTMNSLDEGPVHDSPDFEQYFQEGYCKASAESDCPESNEVVTDVDSSSSPCDGEKCEEDGDNDDMLGGVFAFSEEG
ncbi:autophagy-related protein 18h isoform X1 [Cannabis sativa]|uniref:autophagy-related protein 18h isoform X1 n=1 Tax=Cannabis sativa TaxID=3483 RepID=UPI0029C9D97D|nr:autophagy-related protein 18h isoform X1 [Cannabis sativa]